MHTHLADFIKDTPEGKEADSILRKCVHCGFCTAPCPTYQLLGDELDGPRGRIYLIKRVVEGFEPTAKTQLHLDRCLTCRACETACPSGVQYGRLVDIGRALVDQKVPRPVGQRLARKALKEGLTSRLFAPLLRIGQSLRKVLPAGLPSKVPSRQITGKWPARSHARKMLLLSGCVQPAMSPNINAATARVFDALGIELIAPPGAGCCGAIRHHLNDQEGGLDEARRNIDAWWPHVEAGVESIVINASGCGAMIKEYGHLLRHDSAYAAKDAGGVRRRSGADRGESSLLRLSGHVLGIAARLGAATARPQADSAHGLETGSHSVGEHRLHRAPGRRSPGTGEPLDRMARRAPGDDPSWHSP